jgi:hypothetical protein
MHAFLIHAAVYAVLALVGLHLLGGLFHHGRNRRRGHRVNIGWSLRRGWWASGRAFGGTYYHDL